MKWVNHEIVTGVIVYTVVQDPLLSVYSMAGAIVPDKVEGNPRGANYWRWRKRHRGWSHWLIGYLLLFIFLQQVMASGKLPALADLIVIGSYLCIGAMLHIAEDAICGKVPFFTPWHKIGIKLFKVGSATEYFVAILIVVGCYIAHLLFMLE